jgi:hypothetical protein
MEVRNLCKELFINLLNQKNGNYSFLAFFAPENQNYRSVLIKLD